MDTLKHKLQRLGPLRPEAWDMICSLAKRIEVKLQRNVLRKTGSIAYLSEGLLKEYDQHERELPAIINFINQYQFFVTCKHYQHRYLEACMPCVVYQWNFDDLQKLYQRFNELRPVYEALCAEYEAGALLRMRLLEMPAQERIDAFRVFFRPSLPYLKKKDMANYLSINYSYLIDIWNY
ncbi:hypothetical protein [Pedobacter sp. UBA4863]|uniref:hypothetical protein n=1 Tax=Pedobacter sp. UBA4863 TaxID=1947060 RepID=UPI0025EDDB1E|nr:hypothetical protein [Pedobacter sp. UBA4863]